MRLRDTERSARVYRRFSAAAADIADLFEQLARGRKLEISIRKVLRVIDRQRHGQ